MPAALREGCARLFVGAGDSRSEKLDWDEPGRWSWKREAEKSLGLMPREWEEEEEETLKERACG